MISEYLCPSHPRQSISVPTSPTGQSFTTIFSPYFFDTPCAETKKKHEEQCRQFIVLIWEHRHLTSIMRVRNTKLDIFFTSRLFPHYVFQIQIIVILIIYCIIYTLGLHEQKKIVLQWRYRERAIRLKIKHEHIKYTNSAMNAKTVTLSVGTDTWKSQVLKLTSLSPWPLSCVALNNDYYHFQAQFLLYY